MNAGILLALLLVLWNAFVFFLYIGDKWKARTGQWRVKEKTLLLCAAFFGAPGALLGMAVARHKIRKMKFRILVPLALIAQLGLAVWLLFGR